MIRPPGDLDKFDKVVWDLDLKMGVGLGDSDAVVPLLFLSCKCRWRDSRTLVPLELLPEFSATLMLLIVGGGGGRIRVGGAESISL